jgi:ribosomal protein S7
MSQESSKKIWGLLTLSLMKKGKKHVAEQLVFELVNILREKYKGSSSSIILTAVSNIKPLIGFRNVRLRGSSYKVPFFLKGRIARKDSS